MHRNPLISLSVVGFLLTLNAADGVWAQEVAGPKVLIVTAHPDDETMFAASIYRLTHGFNATVDQAVITDGSGGYDYAMLAEPIYGIRLADEASARQNLPAVRKREIMEGGEIIGVSKYFFLDELDHMYTRNVDTVLAHVWHTDAVRDRLSRIMDGGGYDYVFVLLPSEEQHGHHKGATILTLETAARLPSERRPVVLGGMMMDESEHFTFGGLPGYPATSVRGGSPVVSFDRRLPLEADGLLDYRIIVNWLIAEHKSQGTLQGLINEGEVERFWFFDVNDPARLEETKALFERMNENPYR